MAKEKLSEVYDNSTNSTIGTLFEDLRGEFEIQTHSEFHLCSPDKRSLSKTILMLSKTPHVEGRDVKKKSGVRLTWADAFSGKDVTEVVTIEKLQNMWTSGKYQLASWRTLQDFLKVLQRGYEQVADKVRAKQSRERERLSPSTLEVYGETGSYRQSKATPIIGRYIPTYERRPTEADSKFLYNHLRRDSSDTLYWCGKDTNGQDTVIEIDVKEPDFWLSFWATNDDLISHYLNEIPTELCRLRDEHAEDGIGLPPKSIEEELLPFFPIALLSVLHMATVFSVSIDTETEKECLDFCRYDVGIKTRDGLLCDKATIKTTLTDTLFDGAYFNPAYVTRLKQVSNAVGTAFTVIPLDGVDTTGRKGKELAESKSEPPKLPPEWAKFLHGTDGKRCIFPNDPRMCELRLAFFVAVCANASFKNIRQALYVFGDGECGKTTLLEAIRIVILGEEACATLGGSPKDWYDSKTFGLKNKALVVVQEVDEHPEEIFNDSMFKAITGSGVIQLRKLYSMSNDYKPEHLMFAMSVNSKMAIKDDFVSSRILPLGMAKNYLFSEQRHPTEIFDSLRPERELFLQWCFDTKAYYENQTRINGEAFSMTTSGGVLVLTDDEFDNILATDTPLTADYIASCRVEAIQHIGQIPGCSYRHLNVYSQSELTKTKLELLEEFVSKVFVFEKSAEMKAKELQILLYELVTRKEKKLQFYLSELGIEVPKGKSMIAGRGYMDLVAYFCEKRGVSKTRRNCGYVYTGVRPRTKDESGYYEPEVEEA